MFLTFSSAFILSSIAVLCSGQESTRLLNDIAEPEFRYVEWNDLSQAKQAVAGTGLGYAVATWNNPGTAEVEELSWTSLTVANQAAAVTLGFNEEVWDCFINHYDDFFWEDLATEEVQQYYVTLGWTEDSWNGDADAPESDAFFYNELTAEEKAAANELCYDENLWNEETLPFKSSPLTSPPTSAPTRAPTSSGRRTDSTMVVLATAITVAVVGIFYMLMVIRPCVISTRNIIIDERMHF
jgi:hypothetical protein